jgi:RND family efflux transporter MFP subunit
MKRLFRFLLPLLVLLAGVAIAATMITTGPKTRRQRPVPAPPTVEIITMVPQNYQVVISTRGTVSPVTSSTLVPEVAGKIVKVADNFRNGGFFTAGQQLLQIDPRDYRNAVTIARAELIQRKQALTEEQARSQQARNDWEKLQLAGEPNPLVLRTPQLESVQAQLAAAEARLLQAELELERTRIIAPYAGRILDKKVDLGQYVSPGTALAEIYASDSVEVRLPITSEQQAFLDLPEIYLSDQNSEQSGAKVDFSARVGQRVDIWPGRLVRTEGSIDVRTRQLFVVARIDSPYQRHDQRPPLKIGQFLEARIFGKQLEKVFVIPRQAVRGGKTVHLVDGENHLQRRELDIIWRDEQNLIAAGPLQPGDRLSLTALPFAADGIKVRIAAEPVENASRPAKEP